MSVYFLTCIHVIKRQLLSFCRTGFGKVEVRSGPGPARGGGMATPQQPRFPLQPPHTSPCQHWVAPLQSLPPHITIATTPLKAGQTSVLGLLWIVSFSTGACPPNRGNAAGTMMVRNAYQILSIKIDKLSFFVVVVVLYVWCSSLVCNVFQKRASAWEETCVLLTMEVTQW